MPPTLTDSLLAFLLVLLGLLVLHEAARYMIRGIRRVALHILGPIRASQRWVRQHPVTELLKQRYPRSYRIVAGRLDPHRFSGFPLTLLALSLVYLIALFGGLIQELHEAEELVRLDEAVLSWFAPWRAPPFTDAMTWLTQWGNGAAYIMVGLVASVLWWSGARGYLILPFWATVLGAQITTWTAKYWIDRERPADLAVMIVGNPAFPSSHASAAISVYGFLAYSVWRSVRHSPQGRFEVVFWGIVVIVVIGFSRIFLGVHYLSDVISGYIVGAFWLAVGVTITELRTEGLHNGPLRPKY